MPDFTNFSIAEAFAAGAAAIGGIALGIQKLTKSWKTTSAETSVVDLLHTELDRLSKQNSMLTNELNKLQTEIVKLNSELINLSSENQKLHAEVGNLTIEVTTLKTLLDRRGAVQSYVKPN